jgi:hypothetical protein
VVIPRSWEHTCRFLYDNLSLYNGGDGQFISRCWVFLVNIFLMAIVGNFVFFSFQ